MSEPIQKIEGILKSAYSTESFVSFIKEIFDSIKIIAPDKKNKEYSNFNSHIETYSHIGNYTSPDGKKIAVFEVQLKAASYVENSRSTQRSYARKLIENGNVDGAIIAFFTSGDSKWRLSFVRLDYEMKFEGGKFKTQENLTPAKRYSFLVGKDEPCHTAISRFHNFIIDKNYNPTLDEIEEAFSVEKVTKEFFDLYCEKFYQLQEYLESNRDFKEESERCGFTSEQFAKKLMGQIVFLYFLQKKGWLGVGVWPSTLTEKEYKNVFYTSGAQGRIIKDHLPDLYTVREDGLYRLNSRVLDEITDDDEEVIANHMPRAKTWGDGSKAFLRTIFSYSQTHKKHFYEEYLEPLFYDTLNRNRGAMGYCPALHCRVPFLSGGLFDPIDNYDWKNNYFDIPDEIFSNKKSENDRDADGILDIFDRYNFTMSEDEPMEREVAIDPEMLGKVFENLLEVRDRKSKGAFYTPREIVHYMCQESLINYLVRKTRLKETDIRDFVLYGDFMKDEDTTKEKREGNGGMYISDEIFKIDADGKIVVNRLAEIDEALANVKVADPAVGSGAFPLGMMNEIVRARQNITAYMSIGMNAYNKRMLYQNDRSPYILKYNTIKNCLYAVDIEPSAVDIAQLRLWLSLVIDDEINPNAQNDIEGHRDPLPLPNLECNILCGNSLIDEFQGVKLVKPSDILGTMKTNYQLDFGQNDFEFILKKMLEEQDLLFRCDDPIKKLKHKETIQSYKDMIVSKEVLDNPTFMAEYKKATTMSSKPFIVWELDFARVFRDNGGFDIVIGNPPYVGEKGNKELFRPIAATEFGEKYYLGKMDLFYFFFHKALDIGNGDAEIGFITTNYYPTAFGAKTLRTDFQNRGQIRRLINFNELKVFESALGQHNLITLLTKSTRTPVIAQNSVCKISGVASATMMKDVLYSSHDMDDRFDTYSVAQDDLYEGNERYIRLSGCGVSQEDSVSSVLSKIANTKYHLIDIAFIKQGIVSGADKYTDAHESKYGLGFPKGQGIFILHKYELKELHLSEEEIRHVKPVYKNSQISKYHIDYDDELTVFYLTKNVPESSARQIIRYLEQFKPILASKRETIEGKMPWYSLNWARDEAIFEATEKIVNSRRAKSNVFALETKQYYEQSDIMITVIKPEFIARFPAKYVLALLNSKLFYVWMKNKGKRKGDMLELYGKPLEEIPVKLATSEQVTRIVELVNIGLDSEITDDLLKSIDNIIFDIYELSEAEKRIVEIECQG